MGGSRRTKIPSPPRGGGPISGAVRSVWRSACWLWGCASGSASGGRRRFRWSTGRAVAGISDAVFRQRRMNEGGPGGPCFAVSCLKRRRAALCGRPFFVEGRFPCCPVGGLALRLVRNFFGQRRGSSCGSARRAVALYECHGPRRTGGSGDPPLRCQTKYSKTGQRRDKPLPTGW